MIRQYLKRLIIWAAPKSMYSPMEYKDYASQRNMEEQFNTLVTKTNNLVRQNEQLTRMYRDIYETVEKLKQAFK